MDAYKFLATVPSSVSFNEMSALVGLNTTYSSLKDK